MKKPVKWILLIIAGLFLVILAAAFILPIVFKDDIKAAIDKEIAKSVNADVVFDADNFSLSFFTHFPNITAKLTDLGVLNRAPFEGQILFATEKFEVEVNLKDILFGDQLRVKGISLVRPVINIKVNEDGKANYDIAIPSSDTAKTTEESGDFSFGIDHWEIIDGHVSYDDRTLPYVLTIKGLNHTGGGDFTQDVFDLTTHTVADTVTTSFDGTEYLTDKRATIDATISISEDYSKYTLKENAITINDFAMSIEGWLKMNENDFDMDLSFKSPDNSFKSLLSLVPGMYGGSFNTIDTKGDLAFSGFAKGKYSEKQMPAFNLNLVVKDAMFKYPDLPTAVNNINVDLLIDNKDGVIDNTVIDLKKLHLDFGANPVDARALITKMYPTNLDAMVAAKLNLGELSKMFPLEGLEMKGNYAINLTAKGVYDSLKKVIPAIDASMSLANGYVKSKEFPLPIQDLQFNSTVKNATGKMEATVIDLNNLSMVMDGEKIKADLLLQNLNDYTWDLKVNGGVDLEKISKVFALEGMTLAGKVKADIQTKGKYSDLQAEKYDRLPTSGTASLSEFKYTSKDLPYAVTLSQALMAFDPKKINLQKLEGKIGRSDFNVNGSVLNYLGYVFGDNDVIKGNVNFNSNLMDLNQFMSDEGETATSDTASYGVIPVPKNIDFVLNSSIKTVKLMDFTMTNAVGDVVVKDGAADLRGLRFNMLGGSIVVNGAYDTKNIAHPKYDFALKMENISIRQAANTSTLIRTYAPIAGLINGNFSTDFKLSGELLPNMEPNLSTVDGGGLIKIAQAALKDSKIVSSITSLTNLDDANEVTFKDVLMSASLDNGRFGVKPFDVKFGNYKTTVAGSTGLDQSIDYTLKMEVPAGELGAEYNKFIASKTGAKTDPNGMVPVTIALGGKVTNPVPKLLMEDQKEQLKEAAAETAKEEGTKALEKAVKGTDAEKVVKDILGSSSKDSTKATPADTTAAAKKTASEDVEKQVEDEAKKKIQNFLKKKN